MPFNNNRKKPRDKDILDYSFEKKQRAHAE